MAVTVPSFKLAYPEFDLDEGTDVDATQNALITAKLAAAEAQVDRSVYSSSALADEAVMSTAAHLLALSPSGINARLVKDKKGDPRTLYEPTRKKLVTMGACLLGRNS